MKNIAVFFGGQSVEHEVSVITAVQVMEQIKKLGENVIPVYITKNGVWKTGESLKNIDTFKEKNFDNCEEVYMTAQKDDFNIYIKKEKTGLFKKANKIYSVDICFPILHGTNGEDGTIQGLFEFKNIPYVGPSVLASSVGMDKIIMKKLFKAHGLPVVEHKWFYRKDYLLDAEAIIAEVEKELRYPLIVKPSNLGSSVGISVAKTKEELKKSINIAVEYDRKILIEEKIEDCREINCAVLGVDDNIEASLCEEPILNSDLLSYKDKYIQKGKTANSKGENKRKIPADIPKVLEDKVKKISKDAFKAIDASGVSRIDFLYNDKKEIIYINEINTIPGSLAFYLWEKMNIDFSMLIQKLIEIAQYKYEEKDKTCFSYDQIDLFDANFKAK